MDKILCVAALLVGLLALTGRSSSAAPAPFTSPMIVAKGKLLNQTAPITTTTIFTPTQTGVYRLSVYATLTQTGLNSQSAWSYNLGWTDDAGTQSEGALLYCYGSNAPGQFSYENFFPQGGVVLPFEAKAGMPVTYAVSQIGPPDNSAYSLYYTLERLE